MTALAKALSWATGIDADYYSAQIKDNRHVLRRRSVRVAALCNLWARFEPRIFLTSASEERGTEAPRLPLDALCG